MAERFDAAFRENAIDQVVRDLEEDLGLSLGARIKYLKTEPLLAREAIQLRLNLRATGFLLHHPAAKSGN